MRPVDCSDREDRGAGGSGDCDKMIGVLGGVDTGVQDFVIGGMLLLFSHLRGSEPNQRIAPIQGTSDLGDEQRPAIVAAQVGGLVAQNRLTTVVVPGDGGV